MSKHFIKILFKKIRLVIEESLNQLPYSPTSVITPIGFPYEGLQFEKGNCGVSIVRSGEAMEQVYGNLQWQTYVLHYLLNETNFIFPKRD